ncbi:Cobalamin adenosyltransferase [uncultured archaeon]|nr:Cobalamin adenosyltransferase [uncultured archaeon]
MPFYTRTGDKGDTGLLSKGRFKKHDVIFQAIGDIDELNSAIGLAKFYTHDDLVRKELKEIRNDLFVIGADLAMIEGKKDARTAKKDRTAAGGLEKAMEMKKARRSEDVVDRLEKSIEDIGRRIKAPTAFVIFEGEGALWLDLARTVTRRAERSVLAASEKYDIDGDTNRYLNRLSSYLFAAAIYLNYVEGMKESHPTY